ncbi:serine/threonine protein kinase [Actinocorallia herbida]|uniref:non-specific serine/threonine protein kinase n=1 Tax=Actinocorallia herbida TaxID=58109 RepID=A0A3N1D8P1_9ACTN|nr:serine/threonine-protein kinase [Actinocorallia herbida]ROO89904.1 serine/threonine protein kinase [Actinocorallia herbida]
MEQGPGRLLGGRYRLLSEIGRGGMGAVWRATDTMLDRDIAVKEVTFGPGLSQREKDVLKQRTLREAKASARLNHPNVVTVHDVVEEEGRPWIVMELVPAPSLQDILDAERTIEPHRAAEIGLQVLDALRAAHARGILHRDVKPSNILITDGSPARVVLTDFGIAQMEGDVTLTQTGLVMGSPAYIPPERVQGERATAASDLWSLGATLFAAVEGYAPYERPDAMAALSAALSEPVPRPRNAGRLTRVLEGLLVREPAARMTGDQAMPLLTDVSTSRPNPMPTQYDETVLDRPRDKDVALETVLDPAVRPLRIPPARREAEPEARTLLEPHGWSLEQQHIPPPQPPPPYGYVQQPYQTPPPAPLLSGDSGTRHTIVIAVSLVVVVIAIAVAVVLLR